MPTFYVMISIVTTDDVTPELIGTLVKESLEKSFDFKKDVITILMNEKVG